MTTQETRSEITLNLTRTYSAPREEVFRAWTEPEALKRWFAPSDEFSTPIAEVDLRVGGAYRIGMKPPDQEDMFIVVGTYREVQPPERLVFTWSWEEGMDVGETLVTVEFRDLGGSTEVVLTHELFPNEQARDKHNEGWSGCLERLEKIL
ncbi:MAG: SRPBCC domain-containing protein [bacterium]|nr:SRPBCC domain-containing protein [bacterium]